MAGPIRYFVDAYSDDGANAPSVRNVFAQCARFFDTHPGYDRIAADFDGGAGFGPTNFTSESNENSFGVWRAVSASITFDVALKWSYNQFYDDNWDTPSNFGFAIAMAYHSSSEAWNGTTNNDGTDSFTVPWKSGSIVFPRTNGPGGSNHTDRNAMLQLFSSIASPIRIHVVGDNDAFFILTEIQPAENPEVDDLAGMGIYEAYNTSSTDLPFFQIGTNQITTNFEYGNITQAATDDGGLSVSQSSDVRTFRLDFDQYLQAGDGTYGNDNNAFTSSPILLYQYETGFYQLAGIMPILRTTKDNANTRTTLNQGTLQTFKMVGGTDQAIVIPWPSQPPAGFSGSLVQGFIGDS